MDGFHIGDMLAQLFFLGFIVLVIVLIVGSIRSNRKMKNQLNHIEKKLDTLINDKSDN
ncbi:DUF4083 domain-containing protein [Ornithinibacillus bavariensis]|uniref:DUF4083 domain-containing protein n=1 Tax=Ornithinibacillus bavariensis TaxID=545502 RepID=A0A919X633_9BACI|nr:DUF4083 domain-containing protein [Ornithinibacillus bavariensis]GIO26601.1 hypothetical protein J43TS3_12120 [Ornithinibacillus bavariensis]